MGRANTPAIFEGCPIPAEPLPFLRIPPFPGSKPAAANAASATRQLADSDIDALIARIAELRVGGDYWASQPPLPGDRYTLVRGVDAPVADGPALLADALGPCDPWHLVASAAKVIVRADDELALVAAIAGAPVTCVGEGVFKPLENGGRAALREAFRAVVRPLASPFTGEPMDLREAIELGGFWRKLIDSNRDIGAAVGFAFWKRGTVAPLLWGGGEVRFLSTLSAISPGKRIAVWKARTPPALLAALDHGGAELIDVEDGFIRSTGLGADCIPPLSIVADCLGVHFDPSTASELELLIENGGFTPEMLDRARLLREIIVDSGLSKYGSGNGQMEPRGDGRTVVLVAGQVEDDRAVLAAGADAIGNLDLLRRARASAPEAYIIYKPHPDVEAGHRAGGIDKDVALTVADEVIADAPISSLIDLADEVHVNSSLAGFEALLRKKPVTTHGVPFYAGWGLTRDLGKVPKRRTARRTLDELVAAALLLYPRYVDPVTGLPCPPEILVRRLSEGAGAAGGGALVAIRRLQGRLNRAISALRNWAR